MNELIYLSITNHEPEVNTFGSDHVQQRPTAHVNCRWPCRRPPSQPAESLWEKPHD